MERDEERPGFFRPFSDKVMKNMSKEDWDKYCSLQTDAERLLYVYNLADVKNTEIISSFRRKDVVRAQELKEEGNRAFKSQHLSEAIELYSRAALLAPFEPEGGSEMAAVCVGNRSACLFRQRHFTLCIEDVNSAVLLGFPTRLVYKLNDRKARCHWALRQYNFAVSSFQNVLKSLHKSDLKDEDKRKWSTNTENYLQQISRANVEKEDASKFSWLPEIPQLAKKHNPKYPSASSKISFSESEEEGRFAVCCEEIDVGDVVVVEKAFAAVLRPEKHDSHCLNCFTRVRLPVPCGWCSGVVFCSWRCRLQAISSFHRLECPLHQLLVDSGMSVTCWLSLRLATVTSCQQLLQARGDSGDRFGSRPPLPVHVYTGHSVEDVLGLVAHKAEKSPMQLFPSMLMTIFMLRCLEMQKYFDQDGNSDCLCDERLRVAETILHFIHLVPYNAHEVSELRMPASPTCQENGGTLSQSVNEFLGAAVYPTLALFNHTCDPALVRYFSGNTVVARAVRRIRPGEQVSENYGPIFTQQTRVDRRKHLRERYQFDCNCVSCVEDWPLFHQMENSTLRFKCSHCRAPLCVETESIFTPFLDCKSCSRSTNIMKTLKILQDTEMTFRAASKDIATGELDQGLQLMMENLRRLDLCLFPPQRDFYLCQQAIRNVFLTFGNSYTSKFYHV